jgi:hypothetical protein
MMITKTRDMTLVRQGPLTILAWRDDYLHRSGVNFAMNKHILTIHEPLWFARLRFNMPYRLQRARTWLNPFPVYFVIDSTDCDHVHTTNACRASSGRALLQMQDDIYQSAEGPTHISNCTKDEYEMFEPTWRDYNLEAFEDGHPYSPRR